MVIRYFPISLYICATSFSVCMVCVSTFISLYGLHSLVEICASGIINCEVMYLVSLFCASEKLAFIMFLYRMYFFFWCSSILGGRCYV